MRGAKKIEGAKRSKEEYRGAKRSKGEHRGAKEEIRGAKKR